MLYPVATTTRKIQNISVTPKRNFAINFFPFLKPSFLPCVIRSYGTSPLPGPFDFLPSVDPNDQKKTACYDIDVEVDDTLKTQMNSFLLSTASQQEIATLDNKVGASTR